MTSKSFADNIRSKIKDDIKQERCNEQCYDNCQVDDSGTSHLSIIGEDGSAVAVTSSINDYFGSKVMSNLTGIIFNNQMNDFCKPKKENGQDKNRSCENNNLIKPGKRPLSSMCPTIILHSGQVKMVVGGEGGTNITTSVAQHCFTPHAHDRKQRKRSTVILNYLFFGYDLQKAVKEPRVQITKNETNVEKDFDKVGFLHFYTLRQIYSVRIVITVQAIVREGDEVCAESDYRKGGYPAGYPEPIL
uniref:Gamma-glutamyltranspeptidase 1-like n=1 Tax=Sinocyclocheilus grahami TaxID=75366 RepID=A0A672K423_SINGR